MNLYQRHGKCLREKGINLLTENTIDDYGADKIYFRDFGSKITLAIKLMPSV